MLKTGCLTGSPEGEAVAENIGKNLRSDLSESRSTTRQGYEGFRACSRVGGGTKSGEGSPFGSKVSVGHDGIEAGEILPDRNCQENPEVSQ